ncbi:MAG TPA: TonB family protein [Phnomibacter sp.]|nr:TonB family protein [Phnomibacter sp.]
MKPITALIILLSPFAWLGLAAQPKNKNEQKKTGAFHTDADTMYAMVDKQGKINGNASLPYIRKYWPEAGKWREQLFNATDKILVRTAWYLERECKTRDGVMENYHPNGMMQDSGLYVRNQKQGSFISWYSSGQQHKEFNYKDNIPVDTCMVFRENGELESVLVADQDGNGIGQEYYEGRRLKMIGNITKGERNGQWILKREDGTKMMEIQYQMDSLIHTKCFEADGVTTSVDECIFEKPAEFPRGKEGWRAFLERNLRYPDAAQRNNIQGVVRIQFYVDKEGNLSEFSIVDSPDEILSEEVLRLMKKSPKWEPAIQYNKKVVYRHIQEITFRLG